MELSSSEAGSGVDAFISGRATVRLTLERLRDANAVRRVGDAVTDTSVNSRDRDGSR